MAAQIEVEREVDHLATLSRKELVDRWTKTFRCPVPLGARRQLLERALAWQLQAQLHGGLSPAVFRRLRANAPCRAAAPEDRKDTPSRRLADNLVPGTRLVREWHGRSHCVDVVEDGFVYEGETHVSLSAIARTITGARWSGPRFFGL